MQHSREKHDNSDEVEEDNYLNANDFKLTLFPGGYSIRMLKFS